MIALRIDDLPCEPRRYQDSRYAHAERFCDQRQLRFVDAGEKVPRLAE